MAITSGFFMSVNGDRKYKPEFFAQYFASFIGNGVFPNPSSNLQVISNNDMTIVVKDGKGWIDGYILFNDGDYILNIEPADGVLNRIDRVVLRWDRMDRKVDIVVKQGNFASNPVAPELQRDADAYELALADIAVNRGIISITQANITDLRLNKTLCGIVHGVVDQVDPTAIFNQFESWYKQTKANYDADIANWTQEKKDDFNVWYTTNINEFTDRFNTWFSFNTTTLDSEFTAWFDSIKGQLDGDIAANLAAQITDIQANKVDKVAGKGLSANDYTDLEKAEVGKIKNLATLHELALLEDEVRTHQADDAVHGIGDKTALKTTHKASIVGAVNELFTNVSNGKSAIATAITGKGVVTSGSDTFAKMAGNIGSIKVGKFDTGDIIRYGGGLKYKTPNVEVKSPGETVKVITTIVSGENVLYDMEYSTVYIKGNNFLKRLDDLGNVIWVCSINNSSFSIIKFKTTEILITDTLNKKMYVLNKNTGSTIKTYSNSNIFTRRRGYNYYGTTDSNPAIDIDDDGNIYLGYHFRVADESGVYPFQKFSPSYSLIWSKQDSSSNFISNITVTENSLFTRGSYEQGSDYYPEYSVFDYEGVRRDSKSVYEHIFGHYDYRRKVLYIYEGSYSKSFSSFNVGSTTFSQRWKIIHNYGTSSTLVGIDSSKDIVVMSDGSNALTSFYGSSKFTEVQLGRKCSYINVDTGYGINNVLGKLERFPIQTTIEIL